MSEELGKERAEERKPGAARSGLLLAEAERFHRIALCDLPPAEAADVMETWWAGAVGMGALIFGILADENTTPETASAELHGIKAELFAFQSAILKRAKMEDS